jgi:endonuclease/exonuclease/phosphatase family metal-dependent hydrolase
MTESTSRLTLITYNTHHAAGMDRRVSTPRIASVLKDADADVACLQEVDCRVIRSRRAHQPRLLAKALGMKAVYGATLKWPLGARYGNLALTRLPLIAAHTHNLPLGDEQRGIVEMHVQASFGPIAVFCTHWGLTDEERLEQAAATVRYISRAKMPALLAGDLNEGPEGRAHAILTAAGLTRLGTSEPTYPSPDPTDCIDHVYGTPHWRVEESYTIPSLSSDHRPVVVELRFVTGG